MKYEDLLKEMHNCPFCDLTKREKILENENAFLTYSLAPYHPDHLLICTKRHLENLLDLTDREVQDIDSLQKKGFKILHNLGYKNKYSYYYNNDLYKYFLYGSRGKIYWKKY